MKNITDEDVALLNSVYGVLFGLRAWNKGPMVCTDCTPTRTHSYFWEHEDDCGVYEDVKIANDLIPKLKALLIKLRQQYT